MAKKVTKNVHINVTSNVKGLTGKTTQATDKMSGGFNKAKTSAKGLKGGISGLVGRLGVFGKVAAAATAVVAGMVAGFRAALRVAEGFSKSMSRLEAISGATGDNLTALKDNAEALGKSTQFTAAQVADAQTELAKMGFTTTGILNATSGALNLAVASGIEMAEASEIMASTLNGFGLETAEATRVTDVMAKSFVTSALDAEKYRESMKLIAPIAKSVKVSLEEASAATAVLADVGVSGSLAGTQLRRILSDLAVTTGKDFRTSLDIAAESMANATSTADKLAIAKDLVGDRAKGSLIALVENREKLDDLTLAYNDAGGAAEGMVTKMENNLSGDKKKMKSALEGLGITISETLGIERAMRFVTQKFTGFVSSMEKFFGTLGLRAEKFGNRFRIMGQQIALFAENSGLSFNNFMRKLSEVPLLGKAIDTEALDESEKKIKERIDSIGDNLEGLKDRQQEITEEMASYGETVVETTPDVAPVGAVVDEFVEGEVDDSADGDNKLQRLQDFLNRQRALVENHEDQTHLAKMERMRERALEEAEQLGASQEQLDQIRQGYQARIDAARAQDLEDTKRVQQEKINAKLEELDLMARIFGEESKLGKLALIAKQQMAKIEMQIDGEVTMGKMLKSMAEGTVDYFKGLTAAASKPFPANIPAVAGHIATALPLFMQLKQAFASSKKSTGLSGASVSAPTSGGAVSAPSFNVIGQASAGEQMIAETISQANDKPIRTYVVSGDVSSSQELERKAEGTASLG